MTFHGDNARPTPGARRRAPLLLAGVGAGVALALGAWLWLRPAGPVPPLPDLTGADPEVAAAVEEARRGVLGNPSSARTWGHYGQVLRAHDFDDESAFALERAESLDPREPRWPYLRGLTLLLTDPAAGIRCLERAAERCGDDPPAPRLRLVEALLENGRLDEAQAYLDQAARPDSENPRTRLDLGRLALLRGEWRAALDRLGACTADEHCRKLAHGLCAEAWSHLGDQEKALAARAAAETLSDDAAWPDPFALEVMELQRGLAARHARADSLTRSGQTEEAIALLEDTAKKYPRSLQTAWRLGDLYRQQGRLDLAEQVLRRAVDLDPRAAEGWFRLGSVQAIQHPREAADSLRKAIELLPSHTLAHFNLAQVLLRLGDRQGAADAFRETLRCRPDYAPARAALEQLDKPKAH